MAVGVFRAVEAPTYDALMTQQIAAAKTKGEGKLEDLYRDGCYVTLRLTSSMYHRFHAPHDCRIDQIT